LYAENEALSSVLARCLKPLKINYSEVSNQIILQKEGNKVAYDNSSSSNFDAEIIKVAYLTKVGSRYLA
jgi:iron complex outermembrane receptor protein